METNIENKEKRNYPPRVGEWSYYDSRFKKQGYPHWIINIEEREEDQIGCHYSMSYRKEEPFVSCLGKITAVKYMVKGQLHY